MEIKKIGGGVCAPMGFKAAGIHCGIRKNRDKSDLALIVADAPCAAAAMYTTNKVCGAPIIVTRRHLKNGVARAVVCNSGNANTCNADGIEKADAMCEYTARALGIRPEDVIVASTGVIGEKIDVAPVERAMPELVKLLSRDGSAAAEAAIMTTDTVPKERAVEFALNGVTARIGAIAKGSGMIHPNMATMLSFITTDAAVSAEMLHKALERVVPVTYNMVSVDGDTSTNDTVSLMASGMAGNTPVTGEGEALDCFCEALLQVCTDMARMIAGDGEGATKLIQCTVKDAPDYAAAKTLALSVIQSPLVKTAMFGADANWGRILCAMGYSGADFDVNKVDVHLCSPGGCLKVCQGGVGVTFSEDKARDVLTEDEVHIDISLNAGAARATAWGCDLTYDYVKINGDYRT